MKIQSTLEDLIRAARSGDQNAEELFFSKLRVRFFKLITLELQKNPVIVKRIDLEIEAEQICQFALSELKKLYPVNSSTFSLILAINVLHNVVDGAIANILAELAKQGDEEAENLLFSMIRQKLVERINRKRWRTGKNEHENE
ncbi:MAG: hypothetical protein MUC94_15020 [bacterium]|nr:hypothetical protein [bacterium]